VHLAEGGSSDAPQGLAMPSLATNCALADPPRPCQRQLGTSYALTGLHASGVITAACAHSSLVPR
jgi:hypothetical protein